MRKQSVAFEGEENCPPKFASSAWKVLGVGTPEILRDGESSCSFWSERLVRVLSLPFAKNKK